MLKGIHKLLFAKEFNEPSVKAVHKSMQANSHAIVKLSQSAYQDFSLDQNIRDQIILTNKSYEDIAKSYFYNSTSNFML